MATESTEDGAGGSTFTSMSGVATLTGSENWTEWWSKMRFMLRGIGALNLIEVAPIGEKQAMLDNRAMALVVSKLGHDPMNAIIDADNLKDMCSKLREQYSESGWGAESVTFYGLINVKQDNYSSVGEYIAEFRSYVQRLDAMGLRIDNKFLVYILIGGLGSEYDVWRATKRNNSRNKENTTPPKWQELCHELYDEAKIKQNNGVALFNKKNQQQNKQRNKSSNKGSSTTTKSSNNPGPKYCSHCDSKGYHEEPQCYTKYPHLAPKEWKDKQKKKQKEAGNNNNKVNTNAGSLNLMAFGSNVLSFNASSLPSYLKSNLDKFFHIDSGSTHHICIHRSNFVDYRSTTKDYTIWTGGGPVSAVGIGKIRMDWVTKDGVTTNITLSNVLHVPSMITNLISLVELRKKGVYFRSDDLTLRLSSTDKQIGYGEEVSNLFVLKTSNSEALGSMALVSRVASASASISQPIEVLHKRLGHLNVDDVKKLATMSTGMKIKNNDMPDVCKGCVDGKHTRAVGHTPGTRASAAVDLVHVDLMGPITPTAYNGHQYALILTDDYSRVSILRTMRSKEEVKKNMVDVYTLLEVQTGRKIKQYRTDLGGEFRNNDLNEWSKEVGIHWQFTTPRTPEQDGVSERSNRTVEEKLRSLMTESGLPKKLWPLGLQTIIHIKNRSPTKAVGGITPLEAFNGDIPDLSRLRIFGCTAYVHIPKEDRLKSDKFTSRTKKCAFVGYEASCWQLWDGNKVIRSKDVIFDESQFYTKRAHGVLDNSLLDKGDEWITSIFDDVADVGGVVKQSHLPSPSTSPLVYTDLSGNNDSPPELPKIDILPSMTPTNPQPRQVTGNATSGGDRNTIATAPIDPGSDDDTLSPPPDEDVSGNEEVRPKRNRKAPVHFGDPVDSSTKGPLPKVDKKGNLIANSSKRNVPAKYAGFSMLSYAFHMGADDDGTHPGSDFTPNTFKEAVSCLESEFWKQGMQSELQSHVDNGTYSLVPRSSVPPGVDVISSRWVYKKKKDLQGNTVKYKARWCARGFTQEYGINYEETFASVVKSVTFKLVFGKAALEDLELEQMDMVTAFLNSLVEDGLAVYVEQPPGYEKGNDQVCLLLKTLYGLKQSPRQWYQTLHDYLTKLGLRRLNSDHSVFIGGGLVVAVYVDDLLIAGKDKALINSFKQAIGRQFHMTDLGPVRQYLGMEVSRDRAKKTLRLSQEAYTKKMLIHFGLEGCRAVSTPMERTSLSFVKATGAPDHTTIEWYAPAIGSLIWLMTTTRPDIAFAVVYFSQFSTNPTADHVSGVKRIFQYLAGTAELGITFGLNQLDHDDTGSPVGYVDSDWGGCNITFRSTTGYVFFFNGGVISHTSKRQPTVALSSTEAEYTALSVATKEAVWLRQLLLELDGYECTVTINTDSEGSLALAKNPEFHARTKHINIKVHWVREVIAVGNVLVCWIKGEDNVADVLTKPLDRVLFNRNVNRLGLHSG